MKEQVMIELMQKLLEKLNQGSGNLEIWIPAIVSIITLLINLLFYIFVQPYLAYKGSARETLTKVSVELLNYLTEIVSYDKFDGVPTKIRKYSLQIHLQFKNGAAEKKISLLLEEIYQEVQKRKQLHSDKEIDEWNNNFRVIVRNLRMALAKYCGVL